MNDISTLAHDAIHQAAHQPRPKREASPTTRKLFVLLHGSYGNLFLSKFATGEKTDDGRDKGVTAAMLVWDAALAKFTPDVIEAAAQRLKSENPEFAPNLPQFEKTCEALMPRKSYLEQQGIPRLAAPVIRPIAVTIEAKGDGRDWARTIEARAAAGDKLVTHGVLAHARAALRVAERQAWQ